MTDFLTVKAKRTFAVGAGLKTRHSPEFEIEASEARLLEAQGLVEITDAVEAAVIDDADVDGTAMESHASETEDGGEKPARKSRKG
jgi:hypothetical protein